ncbi:MAG: hypothetical protein JWM59_4097 [Verrucomicrobiales bacterium]|nr:hypothetical protein [Verrucomicrobiales bacterium]
MRKAEADCCFAGQGSSDESSLRKNSRGWQRRAECLLRNSPDYAHWRWGEHLLSILWEPGSTALGRPGGAGGRPAKEATSWPWGGKPHPLLPLPRGSLWTAAPQAQAFSACPWNSARPAVCGQPWPPAWSRLSAWPRGRNLLPSPRSRSPCNVLRSGCPMIVLQPISKLQTGQGNFPFSHLVPARQSNTRNGKWMLPRFSLPGGWRMRGRRLSVSRRWVCRQWVAKPASDGGQRRSCPELRFTARLRLRRHSRTVPAQYPEVTGSGTGANRRLSME